MNLIDQKIIGQESNFHAIYELFLEENRHLRERGVLPDSYLDRKGRVREMLDNYVADLRSARAAGVAGRHRDVILRMRRTLMKILTLDRENERLLLGRRHLETQPATPVQALPVVARAYAGVARQG